MKIVIAQEQIVEMLKASVVEMVPSFADLPLNHVVSTNADGEIEVSFAIAEITKPTAEPKKVEIKAEPKAKGPAFKKSTKPKKAEVVEDEQPETEDAVEEEKTEPVEEAKPAETAKPKKSIFDKTKSAAAEKPTDSAAGAGSVVEEDKAEATTERKKPLFGNIKK